VSKAFLAELIERCGCLKAVVYEAEGSDDVVNIEQWPDVETADSVTKTETFKKFIPS
jgi:quinol monooxygenase YgiN